MDELRKQVRRAGRRLAAERFLAALGWCWLASLSAAALIIFAGKFVPTGILGIGDFAWGLLALAVGPAAAAAGAVFAAAGAVPADIEIDRRFKLKERVSSALALSEQERQTQIGRALVEDALDRVKRVDIAEQFKARPDGSLLYPLAPAVLAIAVALFVSPAVAEKPKTAAADRAAPADRVKRATKTLEKKLAEKREKAKQQGLKEVEDVFKLLERGAEKLGDMNQDDRKKTLVKLNDLARELEKRRRKHGGAEQIKKHLGNLKGFRQGPADNFTKAVRHGDFKTAMQELDKLEKQLKSEKLDADERRRLAEQLDRMREKLDNMCDAQNAAQDKLQQQIDALRRAGKIEEADKLEEMLDKLRAQTPQIEKLRELARQMRECSKCLKDGDMHGAAEALSESRNELQDLQNQLDELEMLDEAVDQFEQCRNAMCCKQCNGAGCKTCQGAGGHKAGIGSDFAKNQDGEKLDAAFRDSQVRQKPGQGPMSVAGFVDGPNKKGRVGEEIKKQIEAAKHSDADPLTGRRIPRKHKESVNSYFSRLRGEGQ